MELKAQIRGNEGVRYLLKGEYDIESNALGFHIMGASIGNLHNPGAASGSDYMGEFLIALTCTRNKARQFSCLVVIFFAIIQGSPGLLQSVGRDGTEGFFPTWA